MSIKKLFIQLNLIILLLSTISCHNKNIDLQNPDSKVGLSKDDSDKIKNEFKVKHQAQMLVDYGEQWDKRELKYDTHTMPFYYQKFGKEPSGGHSLFISLHGGGGTTPATNDQQYKNQQHLYDDTMNSMEGIYLAPRAPTNTWNLWHQAHVDVFLDIIIKLAVIKENVNPNKVYLLGYSAGGDGVYQLAPRMADRWAAASMMAGHPNETSPLALRNTPFALHMGAEDSSYNRNGVAKQWGEMLDSLQIQDPQGYIHDVQVHEGLGHWMNLKDAVALPWMAKFKRNPIPEKVVWKQDDVHHSRFYWLGLPHTQVITGEEIIATYHSSSNEINIIKNYADTLHLFINDDMLNLDKAITIKYQDELIHKGIFKRTKMNIQKSLSERGDLNLVFPCQVSLLNNKTIVE